MLVTIWMWTHEWSLISMRATAFTFDTCHHAFSCLSSLTRSISVRSLRLPRTGTLIRMRSIASAGVSLASRSASAATGWSIRSAVSLSIAITASIDRAIRPICAEFICAGRASAASRPARRRRRLPAQPADRLLPAAPRDPALLLGFHLDDRRLLRRDRLLDRGARDRAPAGGASSLPQPLRALPRPPQLLSVARSESVSRLRGGRRRVSGRRAAAGAGAAAAVEDVPAPRLRHPLVHAGVGPRGRRQRPR